MEDLNTQDVNVMGRSKWGSLNSSGVNWLGGNSEPAQSSTPPLISYIVRLRHKGLRLGSYSEYQKAISDEITRLRDVEKLTYEGIANLLISKGWKSPRGFSLGAESVFSIYKKRKIRDTRLNSPPSIEIVEVVVTD
jgi:hypothetical protein